MKFIIFIALLFSMMLIDAKRVRVRSHRAHSHHRHHAHRYLSHGPAQSSFYQFMLGLVGELSGNPAMIDKCTKIIPGWESAGTADEQADNTKKDMGGETQSTLDKVLKLLGDAIDMVCEYKTMLICKLTSSYKRYRRLLLQGKVRRRLQWWDFDDVWNSVKSAATTVTNAIVSGAKAIGNATVAGVKWVGHKAEELGNWILAKIKEIFDPVMKLFESIKTKIMNYIQTNPLIQGAIKFFTCMLSNGAVRAVKTLVQVIKGFIQLLPSLATPAGWVQLLINLVCGWKDLKAGINFFKEAWNATDKGVKYNKYGCSAGRFLKAIAGVR